METNYTGPTETEHLIKQAAHEVGLAIDIKPATDEHNIGSYSVTFKDKRGDAREIFVPMDASYKTIVAAIKMAKSGKS